MKKLILIPLMLIATIGVVINCALPETELHIASGSFMTHVTEVSFIDDASNEAAGRQMTGLNDQIVKVTGPDADKVYNIEGKKEFKIIAGSLLLLLDPNIKFVSEDQKYTVNLIFEREGYVTRNIPVTFVKNENNGSVEVVLVKTSAIDNGSLESIKRSEGSGNLDTTTGALSNEIVIKADNSAKKGVTTEITVEPGTKMKDSKGNVLKGSVKAEVISFTETNDGTAFFPGGMLPENVVMGDGSVADGAFVSAGFTAVNMTVGGERVSTFEGKPVSVKMDLGANTINPETNAPYKVGDGVDIWSYENENGQWKFEKRGTVVSEGDKLCVMFATTHLSYFNLDYLARGTGGTCRNSALKLKWTGVDRASKVKCRFNIRYVGPAGRSDRWYQSVVTKNDYVYDGVQIDLKNAPRLPIEIEVYDLDNKKPLGTFEFASDAICNRNGDINITAPVPTKQQLISIEFKGLCSSTRVYPPVGTRVFYKKTSEADTAYKQFHYVDFISRLDSKIITTKLEVGVSYTFKVYSGGEAAIREFTAKSDSNKIEVQIPEEICKALTQG